VVELGIAIIGCAILPLIDVLVHASAFADCSNGRDGVIRVVHVLNGADKLAPKITLWANR